MILHTRPRSIIFPNVALQLRDEGDAMPELAQMKCVACRGGEPTVTNDEIDALHPQIPEWHVKEVDGIKRLERVFKFKNFVQALEFTNKVGAIAEEEDHHPMLITEYGKVTVDWWTHTIQGLHMNDFIMAAKTDEIYSQ
jgi:4a-hydroxytetrahydrobiopterin dehydratase